MRQEAVKKVILGANTLLSLLLVLTVFYTKAQWDKLRQADKLSASVSKYKTAPKKRPIGFYSVVSERNIFGVIEKNGAFSGGADRTESGGLRLKGTLVASLLGSFAIIEDISTGEQELYHLGDEIDGAQLISIERREVVLRRGESEEILSIGCLTGFSEEIEEEGSGVEKDEKIRAIDERSRIIPRDVVDNAMKRANQILTEVRIRPHFDGGMSAGFSLRNIRPGSIISEMGFLNGDIIKVVNGDRLDSPEKVIAMYSSIKEAGTFLVDVERKGELVRLKYEIEE